MPTTNYVWDPATDAYLMEQDGSGATTAVYTNEPVVWGSLVSQRRGAATSYYHYDGLGSTRELTDSTEAVTDTNLYDAWGVNVASTGTTENPLQWLGRLGYYRDDHNKYYVRARIYDIRAARWLGPDPVLFSDGTNLYIPYGLPNEPDPSGRQAKSCEIEICSTPVAGVGGHFFILVNGKACRGGPSVSRQRRAGSSGEEQVDDSGNPECECYGKGSGQLLGSCRPFDKEHVDHPEYEGHPYPPEKLLCQKHTINGKSCDELLECFSDLLKRLRDCCIPYQAFPKPRRLDGNSNSAVVWMLEACVGTKRPTHYLPEDGRANPGSKQDFPPCLDQPVRV